MTTYKIVRHYESAGIRRRVIVRGLTLDQAQAHCRDSESSSSTATGATGRARTRRLGRWFDGYTSEA